MGSSTSFLLIGIELICIQLKQKQMCNCLSWRCEHARFCVEVFMGLIYYINFQSFIHSWW